jgi:hypothetical protein
VDTAPGLSDPPALYAAGQVRTSARFSPALAGIRISADVSTPICPAHMKFM